MTQLLEFGVKNNSSSEIIPPFSIVRPISYEVATECVIVGIPNADNKTGVFITGEGAILPSGYGKARQNFFERVSYNPADGTPATGENWGVKANSYSLRKNYDGFMIVGGAFQNIINAIRLGGGGGTLQSVVVVSNVACVAGNIIVTTKTLTGRDLTLV